MHRPRAHKPRVVGAQPGAGAQPQPLASRSAGERARDAEADAPVERVDDGQAEPCVLKELFRVTLPATQPRAPRATDSRRAPQGEAAGELREDEEEHLVGDCGQPELVGPVEPQPARVALDPLVPLCGPALVLDEQLGGAFERAVPHRGHPRCAPGAPEVEGGGAVALGQVGPPVAQAQLQRLAVLQQLVVEVAERHRRVLVAVLKEHLERLVLIHGCDCAAVPPLLVRKVNLHGRPLGRLRGWQLHDLELPLARVGGRQRRRLDCRDEPAERRCNWVGPAPRSEVVELAVELVILAARPPEVGHRRRRQGAQELREQAGEVDGRPGRAHDLVPPRVPPPFPASLDVLERQRLLDADKAIG
mmetsp:Transcript_1903/g.6281  ORF Transcript_1903/g.6281 Transcript_1903/m.6281 type:complete len:361 (+) Transcript_1903:1588-2670(+)